MRCTKCNHELDEHGICPNCYHIHDVQTMSNREINNFDGITIEDENNYRKEKAKRSTLETRRAKHLESGSQLAVGRTKGTLETSRKAGRMYGVGPARPPQIMPRFRSGKNTMRSA